MHIRRGRRPGPSGVPSRPGPVLTGHAGPVMAVQFSPDGRWLASASHDGFARLWHLPGGDPGPLLAGHRGQTGSIDQTVRLWTG